MTEDKYQSLLKKVMKLTEEKKLDLSADEDLSIAVMNLISIEEHLFFSGEKTGKGKYFSFLCEIREMRKELLKKIIKDYEGEVWCISKHLLAASMRLMEVGTKELGRGEEEKAKSLFDKSYKLYSIFWGINLNIIKLDKMEKLAGDTKEIEHPKPEDNRGKTRETQQRSEQGLQKTNIWDKLGKIVQKAVNCCKE